ncbi:Cytochrome P450 [Caenorhabditis elegans]|uniref:Cytochrome P450 n=1 Tax=Caenorhabditis elegans TaxID=6239 RepID=Q27477_CAEEL|nr:Cytochrome P450 [Caenorhabditis elegans]CAA91268.3 Cytochrome P450 [Caenorhabditis elegans]|eukprot:NP_497775.3 CYtochrome P450 family [Caenorhabditis elegans]
MALLILSSLVISIFTFFIYIILARRERFKLREKIGLSGPEPHWFLGNLKQTAERKEKLGYDDANRWFNELHEQYGETFGIYYGSQMNIVISNEKDIKEVFIKNFSNFSDRSVPSIYEANQLTASLLMNSYSSGWKHTRSAIAPIFSTGKMKAMQETINSKVDLFLDILREKASSGQKWDIYDDFQGLTLDVIGKCAFAIDSNCQRDRNDVFYVNAKKYISNIDIRHSKIIAASVLLPELSTFWKALYKYTPLADAEIPLVEGLSNVYERRRGGEGSDSVDLLKLLLNREDDKSKPMTKQEVIENCFAFLLAGYETTSTAMTYCSYLLSKYPNVQQKLYEEIMEAKENGGLTYDSIHNMKYLDCVYKETLRFYPPVIHFIRRLCREDITIRGQFYPKGAIVVCLPHTVHRNPENWDSPEEFHPERFENWEEKSSSLKWIPFGVGPRYCVGMRFAEMEFKTTIVKLLDTFELKQFEGEADLIPDCNGVIMRPNDPVRLHLKPRN